jgi:hypothetical protein
VRYKECSEGGNQALCSDRAGALVYLFYVIDCTMYAMLSLRYFSDGW